MSLIEQLKHPVDDIYTFVRPYFPEFSDEDVRNVIVAHWMYGTIDAVEQDGRIIAVCRWNVSPSGKVFDILDLFIAPNEHGVRIMKHLIARNWSRYPEVQFIRFARNRKYPGRLSHIYSIKRLLHLKES